MSILSVDSQFYEGTTSYQTLIRANISPDNNIASSPLLVLEGINQDTAILRLNVMTTADQGNISFVFPLFYQDGTQALANLPSSAIVLNAATVGKTQTMELGLHLGLPMSHVLGKINRPLDLYFKAGSNIVNPATIVILIEYAQIVASRMGVRTVSAETIVPAT